MNYTIDAQDIHSLVVLAETDLTRRQHNEQISYIIAGNELTSAAILEEFSRDVRSRIRRRVAENPAAPIIALLRLADDASSEVRAAVAENRNTPIWLLNRLAEDISLDVLCDMAGNPHLPEPVLRNIAEHDNPYISSMARRTLRKIAFEKSCNFADTSQSDCLLDLEKRLLGTTRIVSKAGAVLRIFHAKKRFAQSGQQAASF